MQRCLALLCACTAAAIAHAGPPFLTDDPDPVERHHAEVNLIDQATGTDAGRSGSLVAEFNDGCARDTQCHVALPVAFGRAAGSPLHAGLGDAEIGVKYRFLDRPDSGWSAAVYPTLFVPTGDAARGLGNGRLQVLLPVWVQRSVGDWHWDAGVACLVNTVPTTRNTWFTGVLAERSFGERLSLGVEGFRRTSAVTGEPASTGFNVGAIANIAPHRNLLVSAGRGLTEVATNRHSVFFAYQLEM